MTRIRFRPFHLFGGILLILILPGVSVITGRYVAQILEMPGLLEVMATGVLVGILADQFVFLRIKGFHTLEHEMTHAIAALLLLRKVRRFVVTRREGGFIQHSSGFGGRFGDAFILLAPYVVPTFFLLLVLVRPFILADGLIIYDAIVGFSLGFHTWSTLREIRSNWSGQAFRMAESGQEVHTDIKQSGFVFSLVYIPVVTLLLHGLCFSIIAEDYRGSVDFLSESLTYSTTFWLEILDGISSG